MVSICHALVVLQNIVAKAPCPWTNRVDGRQNVPRSTTAIQQIQTFVVVSAAIQDYKIVMTSLTIIQIAKS
jgi:hypothetical protein